MHKITKTHTHTHTYTHTYTHTHTHTHIHTHIYKHTHIHTHIGDQPEQGRAASEERQEVAGRAWVHHRPLCACGVQGLPPSRYVIRHTHCTIYGIYSIYDMLGIYGIYDIYIYIHTILTIHLHTHLPHTTYHIPHTTYHIGVDGIRVAVVLADPSITIRYI
jgi:hypothetical protein